MTSSPVHLKSCRTLPASLHRKSWPGSRPPENLTACLKQLIDRKRELDFPWYPARVVCHGILGQTALVRSGGFERCHC